MCYRVSLCCFYCYLLLPFVHNNSHNTESVILSQNQNFVATVLFRKRQFSPPHLEETRKRISIWKMRRMDGWRVQCLALSGKAWPLVGSGHKHCLILSLFTLRPYSPVSLVSFFQLSWAVERPSPEAILIFLIQRCEHCAHPGQMSDHEEGETKKDCCCFCNQQFGQPDRATSSQVFKYFFFEFQNALLQNCLHLPLLQGCFSNLLFHWLFWV